jgi:hypothetical protein
MQKIRKKIRQYIVFIFLFILGANFMKNINVPKSESILKEAIKRKDIPNSNYILCQWARVTGFDWRMIRNEEGEKTKKYIKISGVNPFIEFNFKYEFLMSGNSFILYIEEKKIYYSEEERMEVTEYTVTGWDILYPIKREPEEFFITKRYIVEGDLAKKKSIDD